MDKNTASKTKIVSIVISLGIIATLIIGVISVVRSVNSNRNNENNIVNLNETQENVAIKTEDVTDDVLGNIDDELQEANAGASMAVDIDNISNKADNTYNTHKAGTDDADKETEPTVPPTLSSEEVMAEAMKNFAFDESNKLAWPVLGQIVLDYNMDETIFFKSLGMYKCNPAIIIQSEVGTNVAAAASGIVTDVANLSETGTTVTVSTGLIENVNLKKGDKVVAGQLIGTVASPSAYYIEEGPGVYFKLTQYGEPINPDTYFVE